MTSAFFMTLIVLFPISFPHARLAIRPPKWMPAFRECHLDPRISTFCPQSDNPDPRI